MAHNSNNEALDIFGVIEGATDVKQAISNILYSDTEMTDSEIEDKNKLSKEEIDNESDF